MKFGSSVGFKVRLTNFIITMYLKSDLNMIETSLDASLYDRTIEQKSLKIGSFYPKMTLKIGLLTTIELLKNRCFEVLFFLIRAHFFRSFRW